MAAQQWELYRKLGSVHHLIWGNHDSWGLFKKTSTMTSTRWKLWVVLKCYIIVFCDLLLCRILSVILIRNSYKPHLTKTRLKVVYCVCLFLCRTQSSWISGKQIIWSQLKVTREWSVFLNKFFKLLINKQLVWTALNIADDKQKT